MRGRGVTAQAVIDGPIPVSLWGFRGGGTVVRQAEQVTDAALRSIETGAGRRQLLWIHYFDLHALHEPVGDREVPARPAHLPPRYRAAALTIDRAIGRLIAELDRRGLLARTVILMTGDHGEGLGAHGVAAHSQSGFEEVLRVPGILRGPGIPAGSVAHLVSHRDIPATLLGALGLAGEAAAAERFGQSWLRLRDESRPLHRFVIARSARWVSGRESYSALGVLVDARHKLVAGLEDDLVELYDLAADPGEQHDLASRDPDTTGRLRRQLAAAWDFDYQPRDSKPPIR
jgi:arylsulfatase A-like enzyme